MQPSAFIALTALATLCASNAAAAGGIEPPAAGFRFKLLHEFNSDTEGVHPNGDLVFGPDGALYGTNQYFGPFGQGGTAFRVTVSGDVTVLHAFDINSTDGSLPVGGLALAGDGKLYGATQYGGTNNEGGTLYRVSPDGDYTLLHSFSPSGDDIGHQPIAPPIQASDGNFYGTTSLGGGSDDCGAIYRMTPAGDVSSVKVLARSDGCNPRSQLLQARDGMLYGTTRGGGRVDKVGSGAVFRMALDGSSYEVVHAFRVWNGKQPVGNLIQGIDGKFYGATAIGGVCDNCVGTVFKLSAAGQFTLLHSFPDNGKAGFNPRGGLVQGPDGTLYGTTYDSEADSGAVYRMSTTGDDFRVLYAFGSEEIGGGVTLAPDGVIYGTFQSGSLGPGGVFKLKPVSR